MEQQPGHAVLNDVRESPPTSGGNGRAVHPRALGDGVGERLRKRGQRVHVHAHGRSCPCPSPTRQTHTLPFGQSSAASFFEHFALCSPSPAMTSRMLRVLLSPPGQRPRISVATSFTGFSRAAMPNTTSSAPAARPTLFRYACAVHRRRARCEIDAIVDGEHRLRVKAALDQHLAHRVGHADVIVKAAQGDRIDRADTSADAAGGPDSRAGSRCGPSSRWAHGSSAASIAPVILARAAVAVDDLKALVLDHARQRADARGRRRSPSRRCRCQAPAPPAQTARP